MAGHMKLGKLIVLYDSNDISLDGPTSKAFTENVGARYEAYGWQHILVKDGNDLDEIEAAIEAAKAETDKPTLIEVKTVIGYGAPKKEHLPFTARQLVKRALQRLKLFMVGNTLTLLCQRKSLLVLKKR